MERVLSGTNQAEYMKVNGRMIRGMDLDLRNLQMKIITSVNMSMARFMVKANINGHLDKSMKVLGRKA